MNNGDWCYEEDEEDEKMIVVKTKYLIFDPLKKRVCVEHYLTIDDLRVKTDAELDMKRKELFNMGKYELEEGELLIE
jgi:hypothetical protein